MKKLITSLWIAGTLATGIHCTWGEEIQVGSKAFEVTIPEIIPESSLKWSAVEAEIKSELRLTEASETNLVGVVRRKAEMAAKKYNMGLIELAERAKKDPLEISGIFQSGRGAKDYPEIQAAHNKMVAWNQLLDALEKGPVREVEPTPEKKTVAPGKKMSERPAALEW